MSNFDRKRILHSKLLISAPITRARIKKHSSYDNELDTQRYGRIRIEYPAWKEDIIGERAREYTKVNQRDEVIN